MINSPDPEEIRKLLANGDSIRQWLLSKPPDEIVGSTCKQCFCVLAKFLEEKGFGCVAIGNLFDLTTFQIDATGTFYDLPEFASDYASYVDEQAIVYSDAEEDPEVELDDKQRYPDYPSVPVSAKTALLILDLAEQSI